MQNLVAAFHFPGVLLFRLLIIILLFILDKMMVRFRLFVFFLDFSQVYLPLFEAVPIVFS